MLCTVARTALPREHAECLLFLLLWELSLSTMNFSLFPPCTLAKRPAGCIFSTHFIRGGGGRGCATPPSALTSRPRELGAGAGGVRPGGEQGWQPALLLLARRREKLRGFGALLQESCGLQPPRRQERYEYLGNETHEWDGCRTCCEHNFPQFWDILG